MLRRLQTHFQLQHLLRLDNMIKIYDAKQSDLEYVMQYPINPEVTKNFEGLTLDGWCKTGVCDGEILGVGGVVVFWPGVGEGYYCLSGHVADHKIEAVLCIKQMIELSFKELVLHRLQTTIRKDFKQAIKLVEHAGFILETPNGMAKYTQEGIDSYLYSIVR